jgi:hypothetical protein
MLNLMKYIYLFILLISCSLTSSCAYHNEYPSSWSPLNSSPQGDCTNISGKFMDKGEFGGCSEYKASLSHKLFGHLVYKMNITLNEATHVLFSQNNNEKIKVTVLKNDKEIYSKLFEKTQNQFECEEGFVKIPINVFLNMDGVLAKEWITLYLVKSEDYLTIKSKNSTVGMMFFIPAVATSTSWLRFKQIHN